MAKVIVYTKNNCAKCNMTKMVMDKEGIEYKSINIEEDLTEEEMEAKLQEFRDAGFLSMPVVEAEGYEAFSDFQPNKIKELK